MVRAGIAVVDKAQGPLETHTKETLGIGPIEY